MKKPFLALASLVIIAAVGYFAFQYVQSQKSIQFLSTALPDLPNLPDSKPEMAKRIESLDSAIRANENTLANAQKLSRLYHANGYTNEAWSLYNGLVKADPRNPEWPYQLASILAGYGQLEDALPLYKKSNQLAPDYLPTYMRLGDSFLKSNQLDQAKSEYNRLLSLSDKNPYALVGLARVAIAQGDWSQARNHLESAIQASSFQIGADLLADVYEKLGLADKERIVLKNSNWGSFVDIPDPWKIDLMYDCYDAYQVATVGGWLAFGNELDKGIEFLKRAIELDPKNPHYHYQIAGFYEGKNQPALAKQAYERCVELQPDFADAWLRLIVISKQSGNSSNYLLDTALQNCPLSPSLHISKGEALMQAGSFSQAEAHYKRSIELRPNEAIGYISLGHFYFKQNRIEEGIAQMRLALQEEPNNQVAITTVALNSILQGDETEATRWLKRIKNLPRISDNETQPLLQKFQQQFGHSPNL